MSRQLLLADAVINLVLGALLLFYPARLVEALGLPQVASALYPSILGGVLFGIGVALLVERATGRSRGLGLEGAIAINFCGAGVLVAWLLIAPSAIPVRGRITLWTVATLVIGIGVVELWHRKAPGTRDRGTARHSATK